MSLPTFFSAASNATAINQLVRFIPRCFTASLVTQSEAKQQTAKNLVTQAQNDLTLKERLIKLGQFVSENAGKTVVSEGVKGVIKLLLFML